MKRKPDILILIFLFLLNAGYSQTFYTVERLSFNTGSNEMAPFIVDDVLIFSSDRKNDIMVTVDQSGSFMYNLYQVDKKKKNSFANLQLFSKSLTTRYNQSSAVVSYDGKTLFYTNTIGRKDNNNDISGSDTLNNGIFMAGKGNDDWTESREFPYNNEKYNVINPCLNKEGDRLYFASDDPQGYGGYDLYYSDREKGKWHKPVNLGPAINTKDNEVFPFLLGDYRLYFASRGHGGHGGLDIFYADYIDGVWQEAVNLPKPFNSNDDDFAFVSNSNMDTGYFTSNRKGSDDIFQFVSTFPSCSVCPMQKKEDFCYEFYETGSMELDTTSLKYEWDMGDGTKIRDLKAEHCYTKPGDYLVQLNVIDTLTGEIYFSEASYDLKVERIEQPLITSIDTAFVNSSIVFDASESKINSFTVKYYYWDFGDGSNADQVRVNHMYPRPGNYLVQLVVTDNSDNRRGKMQKSCVKKQIVIIKSQ